MTPEDKYESLTLEKYEPQMWTCMNCYCGLCVESCPVFIEWRNETGAARGLAQVGLGLIKKELYFSDIPKEVIYGCSGCRWCEWNCSQNTLPFVKRKGKRSTRVSGATIVEIIRSMKVEEGDIPKEVRDALSNIAKSGNPFGGSKKTKDKWVTSIGLNKERADTILYVGANTPYEEKATKMAEAIVEILRVAGIKIGMLGSDELESGAFARAMGEEGLFSDMVEHNVKTFRDREIKLIICVSPHDYDTFVNFYPKINGLEVKHYTQVFYEQINQNKIIFTKKLTKKVSYHDPCYLGRKNSIYEEPRNILKSIPGLQLVEMERNRQSTFCCGGGGTGLFYELPTIKMELTRADHAKEKDVEVIAVACPICLQMLDTGIKGRNYSIEVMDIAQLMKEAL